MVTPEFGIWRGALPKKNTNPVDAQVGSRVRLRRMLIGMSQERLGELLGLTFQQVQKYEKGTNRVSAGRLQKIADLLNIPVTFFYGIQQTGGLVNIQVRWINPDGMVARTSDQPMDQSREGALWTWQVDRLEQRDLAQAGVWVVELMISGHRVGRYPLLVRAR